MSSTSGGALPGPRPRFRPVAAQRSLEAESMCRGAAPGPVTRTPVLCVQDVYSKARFSPLERKTPRRSRARDHATEPCHTLAPARGSMHSIEHGSEQREQLAFSSPGALLLSFAQPSRGRTYFPELKVGTMLQEESYR